MPKPAEILEVKPEDIDRPLTPEEKEIVEKAKDDLDWTATPKDDDEAQILKDQESQKVLDEEKDAEEATAKEQERITAKAEELGKTVEEVAEIEAKESEESEAKAKEEDDRIAKVAEETGKTVEEVKAEEEANKPNEEEAEQQRLEEIAKEEGITVEEVKTNEDKDKSVVENYSSDPIKIAKALRKENSAYGKIKAENEELVKFKQTVEANQVRYNEQQINEDLEASKDKIIDRYIEQNPNEADEEEGVIFERAKTLIKTNLKKREDDKVSEIKEKAVDARKTHIEKLPEEYKDYIPEVKELLEKEEDELVLNEGYSAINLANWARGKKMTPAYIKSLEDASYKRGAEQPKIKEKKAGVLSNEGRGGAGNKSTISASQGDVDRALEMFSSKEDWTREKKIEEYMKNHKQHDSW